MLSPLLRVLVAFVVAHPLELGGALYLGLNVLNARLPAAVRAGPLGALLHLALDRIVATTRLDAPGTLKWPVITGSLLRAVADAVDPRVIVAPTRADEVVLGRPTVVPPLPVDPAGWSSRSAPATDPTRHEDLPPPDDGQRGSADLRSLVATLLIGLLAGAIAAGCPNWNRPACPAPGRFSCVADLPRICSPTRELTPIGDEPCAMQGRSCALDDAGVAWCARRSDGGAEWCARRSDGGAE